MEHSARTIVIGAGVIGLGTAHALRRMDEGVLCLEATDAPGGVQSRGPGRIMRNLHRDPELIELARAAAGEWRALETQLGAELLGTEGQLIASQQAEEHAELLRERVDPLRWLAAGGDPEPVAGLAAEL